jgi:hypothetical protein
MNYLAAGRGLGTFHFAEPQGALRPGGDEQQRAEVAAFISYWGWRQVGVAKYVKIA